METNFEKIKQLVNNSSVSESDKIMFLESCEGVVDDNLALLVDLFNESSEWIVKMIDNFREKRDAAYERNMQRWRDIIDKEVVSLEEAGKMEQFRNNLA